ncbi:hypothetical protein EXIGLDRAFT_746639 [Exidia glandulosa HHB12029]|uniref:F-box domain-containing protein n=1 Tax=Exidia glandulosa HHB12029 TaxID=1314781 RepID=A0A165LWU6_EXIGL|nr:hypothetical protein EXIGLDRAFT_746639 [Exidia glandulosa HHB12029]
MASLPPELWLSILQHFQPSTATRSLARLAQVSQFFNALATPVLYHTVRFRRTAQIQLFKNVITVRPDLAARVRIIVFSRDTVDIPPAPLRARYQSFFEPCTALRGIHILDGHFPHPSNKESAPGIRKWLSNPTPVVRCMMLTYDGIWGPGTFSRSGVGRNVDPTLIKLPPGLETLHIERLEYADRQLDPGQACDTLRNVSARVVIGDVYRGLLNFRSRAIENACWFLWVMCQDVQSESQVSRARIFFPSAALVQEVYAKLDEHGVLQQIAGEERVEIVVHDFGTEGYAQAVYAEMCGDNALWSLGVPERSKSALQSRN